MSSTCQVCGLFSPLNLRFSSPQNLADYQAWQAHAMDNRKPTNSRLVPIPGSPDRSIHPFSAKRHQKKIFERKISSHRKAPRPITLELGIVCRSVFARSLSRSKTNTLFSCHAYSHCHRHHRSSRLRIPVKSKWLHIMPPRSCDGLRRRRVNLLFGIDRLRRNWRIADTSNCSCYALPCIGLIGW